MSDWKILITDGLSENGQSILRGSAVVDDRNGIDPGSLVETVGKYHAMIVRSRTKVTSEVISAGMRLKVVGRAGVGVDNIDLEAASTHGITVVNAPSATTVSVAEHTLALMLGLARMIPIADKTMKSGEWAKKRLRGVELYGKTLGIIGMGRIGSAVAERAAPFRMKVIGYDPLLSEEQIRQNGAIPVTLDALYRLADYITLHVPLGQGTQHMIDGPAIRQMKAGVRLICTARGGVIDEEALLEALESGHVSGAGLDVYANEPPGLTALVTHPNVVVSPHIAAQTAEAQTRTAEDIATEVIKALQGEELRWRVV